VLIKSVEKEKKEKHAGHLEITITSLEWPVEVPQKALLLESSIGLSWLATM